MLSPTKCGFVKVDIFEIITTCVDNATNFNSISTKDVAPMDVVDVKKENYQSKVSAVREKKIRKYNETFNIGFNIQYITFVLSFKMIIKNINDLLRNKRVEDQNKMLLEMFSREHILKM